MSDFNSLDYFKRNDPEWYTIFCEKNPKKVKCIS